MKLGELTLKLEQNMPETAILSEDHQISEGEGTIIRPIVPLAEAAPWRRPTRT